MTSIRTVKQVFESQPTLEGAGVHLNRVFGFHETPNLDPFLLLDDFHSNNPAAYLKGFPWHPHRGIETITYMLAGTVEHGDSMGNTGIITPGDVQWMTAGSGIIHQEMPKGDDDGWMAGFQLWANLPASHKMMAPRYRDVKHEHIPTVTLDNGVEIKIICGEVNGVSGPVQDVVIDPEYLDVTIPAGTTFSHRTKAGHTVFAYTTWRSGKGSFAPGASPVGPMHLIIFNDGNGLEITAGDENMHFLLISGEPIREPVAWYGPIVMNTQEELRIAFEEYQQGTFLKHNR
ncbi:MAG: pirin family protein [Anaerolineae bacterium]